MNKFLILIIFLITGSYWTCTPPKESKTHSSSHIRFASYNVALYRNDAGALKKDLESGSDPQIKNVAAVIQRVRPDVLALMEFDHDPSHALLAAFQENYLKVSQVGEKAIEYPYYYSVASNTGVLSGQDYNNDGKVALPEDGYGFGRYAGQYASALLSKYPISLDQVRSFQNFRWKDMPDAKQPKLQKGKPYYEQEEWETFRLSSKNHIALPVQLPDEQQVYVLLAHPTPPVFDGPEDRNGLRNYDEIRLLKDIVSGANYLIDDNGQTGGLSNETSFVIMGDLNADPLDGDSYPGAIQQLLTHPRVHQAVTNGPFIPASEGGKLHNQKKGDKGDPAYDTAFFGKRIDYVIPSNDAEIHASGVFWPGPGTSLYEQVKDKAASDHLLVWVDLSF